ncbi:MAG: hypothetical protein NC221_04035 [Duncaniella sp.]|nr:hypothetical protein [Muribaculum sp.]MCM1255270.1 hypothetical protein [Duncaniella sp.]
MKNLIQFILSCMFIGMLALFTSCTEEEINNFSSLNVLDKPKVSAEMAQKLASGAHFATYEYVGKRIFSKSVDETDFRESDENNWLPGIFHRDKLIINGNEFYVSGEMILGLYSFLKKGYNDSGNKNLIFDRHKFLIKQEFNYNIQTSEFYSYLAWNGQPANPIIFSMTDDDIVIKQVSPLGGDGTLIVFYYYKKTDDHDLSNIHSFPDDTELFNYFVPYLKEIYGDRYEELYRHYKGMQG